MYFVESFPRDNDNNLFVRIDFFDDCFSVVLFLFYRTLLYSRFDKSEIENVLKYKKGNLVIIVKKFRSADIT